MPQKDLNDLKIFNYYSNYLPLLHSWIFRPMNLDSKFEFFVFNISEILRTFHKVLDFQIDVTREEPFLMSI